MVNFHRSQIAVVSQETLVILVKGFDEKALKSRISQQSMSVTIAIYHESFFQISQDISR